MTVKDFEALINAQDQAAAQQRQGIYQLLGQQRAIADRLLDAMGYLEALTARRDTLQALGDQLPLSTQEEILPKEE